MPAAGTITPGPPDSKRFLYLSEGNRMRRVDVDTIATGRLVQDTFIERAATDPVRGRDVNRQICTLGGGGAVTESTTLGSDTARSFFRHDEPLLNATSVRRLRERSVSPCPTKARACERTGQRNRRLARLRRLREQARASRRYATRACPAVASGARLDVGDAARDRVPGGLTPQKRRPRRPRGWEGVCRI